MNSEELNKTFDSSPLGAGGLVILGGGESGVGAALLGKKQGYNVFVSDGGLLKESLQKRAR